MNHTFFFESFKYDHGRIHVFYLESSLYGPAKSKLFPLELENRFQYLSQFLEFKVCSVHFRFRLKRFNYNPYLEIGVWIPAISIQFFPLWLGSVSTSKGHLGRVMIKSKKKLC